MDRLEAGLPKSGAWLALDESAVGLSNHYHTLGQRKVHILGQSREGQVRAHQAKEHQRA